MNSFLDPCIQGMACVPMLTVQLMSKLERLVGIDAVIRAGGYPSVRSFVERFEVSPRSIHDDIAYLRDRLGAPLRYSGARRGYYYMDPSWPLPSIVISEGELMAFFLSVELTRRYLGTAFEAPLRQAVDRLASRLPVELQVDLGQLAQHYTFQPGATAGADPALLAALFQCVRDCHRLEMTYFTASRGERSRRVIEPYHLYNVRGDWQVIAFDHLRRQFRNFAVSNIEAWLVRSGERFARDADFSPASYLAQGFLAEHGDTQRDVALWCDEYQARYIRRREWHPTQQIEEHADGALTLRFRTGALGEVRRWVLSMGPHARVLEPTDLAAEVAEDLRAALNRYESR